MGAVGAALAARRPKIAAGAPLVPVGGPPSGRWTFPVRGPPSGRWPRRSARRSRRGRRSHQLCSSRRVRRSHQLCSSRRGRRPPGRPIPRARFTGGRPALGPMVAAKRPKIAARAPLPPSRPIPRARFTGGRPALGPMDMAKPNRAGGAAPTSFAHRGEGAAHKTPPPIAVGAPFRPAGTTRNSSRVGASLGQKGRCQHAPPRRSSSRIRRTCPSNWGTETCTVSQTMSRFISK
jgi:hypothetical protein